MAKSQNAINYNGSNKQASDSRIFLPFDNVSNRRDASSRLIRVEGPGNAEWGVENKVPPSLYSLIRH